MDGNFKCGSDLLEYKLMFMQKKFIGEWLGWWSLVSPPNKTFVWTNGGFISKSIFVSDVLTHYYYTNQYFLSWGFDTEPAEPASIAELSNDIYILPMHIFQSGSWTSECCWGLGWILFENQRILFCAFRSLLPFSAFNQNHNIFLREKPSAFERQSYRSGR